jgi:hypothetical protein
VLGVVVVYRYRTISVTRLDFIVFHKIVSSYRMTCSITFGSPDLSDDVHIEPLFDHKVNTFVDQTTLSH